VSREIERHGIHLADLDPTRGGEIAKTCPVVVVSLDAMNRHRDTVVVCPLTTCLHPRWRSRMPCMCGGRRGEIAVDQIRTISKERLGRRIDRLEPGAAAQLRQVITEMYGQEDLTAPQDVRRWTIPARPGRPRRPRRVSARPLG
jgi:mRNA interferase MazF